MYKNRKSFYINNLLDKRKSVFSLVESIEQLFLGPLYIEVSLDSNYQNRLMATIDYAGGFPSRTITSNTIKRSVQLFKKKLTELWGKNVAILDTKNYLLLRDQLVKNYYALYYGAIQGGVILNGRKANKCLLRKDNHTISADFSWQMPAEARNNEAIVYKQLHFELTPKEIKKELFWQLSARADLFKQLITVCDTLYKQAANSFKKNYAHFCYEGNCTDLMLALSVVYAAGKITNENGEPINFDTFLTANLKVLGVSPKNMPDLKDQVLTMETKKQEGKVNKWLFKGIDALNDD